ncbi:type I 3-dehydroquinate dehydratase [Desulfurobacterium sp.]
MLLGTVELGKIPRVILATDDKNTEEKLFKARELKIDLIEARIDLIKSIDRASIKKFLDTIGDFGFYAVATVRPVWEGGKFSGTEEERLGIIKEVAEHPIVVAVDVELRAEMIIKRVITFVKGLRKKIIISYHDFEKTPQTREIKQIVEKAKEIGGDIVKCAFKANTLKDVADTLCTMKSLDIPKIFMLMGDKGAISRVDGFYFGSLLTYTFFGKPVAPGQIEAEKLVKLLLEFYPDYRKEKLKADPGL